MHEIAETLAGKEESVEKIVRQCVGRSAAMKARIRKMEAKEAKPPTKPPRQLRLSAWSGRRESNPRMQLGKLPFCH
jgi:hypothetical protein